MMSQGNGQPVLYAVSMSQQTIDLLKQLHLEAAEGGRGTIFLSAFRQIVDRLRKDPLNFGEPLYHLPGLQMTVRQGSISPLLVDFAVHDQQPRVFIRGFKLFQ